MKYDKGRLKSPAFFHSYDNVQNFPEIVFYFRLLLKSYWPQDLATNWTCSRTPSYLAEHCIGSVSHVYLVHTRRWMEPLSELRQNYQVILCCSKKTKLNSHVVIIFCPLLCTEGSLAYWWHRVPQTRADQTDHTNHTVIHIEGINLGLVCKLHFLLPLLLPQFIIYHFAILI